MFSHNKFKVKANKIWKKIWNITPRVQGVIYQPKTVSWFATVWYINLISSCSSRNSSLGNDTFTRIISLLGLVHKGCRWPSIKKSGRADCNLRLLHTDLDPSDWGLKNTWEKIKFPDLKSAEKNATRKKFFQLGWKVSTGKK